MAFEDFQQKNAGRSLNQSIGMPKKLTPDDVDVRVVVVVVEGLPPAVVVGSGLVEVNDSDKELPISNGGESTDGSSIQATKAAVDFAFLFPS